MRATHISLDPEYIPSPHSSPKYSLVAEMAPPRYVRDVHLPRKQVEDADDDDSNVSGISPNSHVRQDPLESEGDEQQNEDRRRSEDEPKPAFDIEARPTGEESTPPNGGLVLGGGQTIKLMLVPDKPPAPPPAPAKENKPHPQAKMKKFWTNFDPEYTGKVTRILPDRITDKDLSAVALIGETAHKAVKSYEHAKEACIRDVKRIIKECRASNQKYTDSHWDIERDLKVTRSRDCLDGLIVDDGDKELPADAKRIPVSGQGGCEV